MAEDALIDWLRASQSALGEDSLIGDDAAILPRPGAWAVTVDTQQEGVHFFPGTEVDAVARRLLAVNLSDLAAMGAKPEFGFLALAAPAEFDHQRFFTALIEAGRRHGVRLAGGDLSRAPQCLAALTLLGSKGEARRWLRRDAARPGHTLWVGGTLGQAALGLALLERAGGPAGFRDGLPPGLELSDTLQEAARQAVRRHQEPLAQLELGQWLGSQSEGAAMDVSDGLAKDLHRLCKESRVGVRVELEQLPLAPSSKQLCDRLDLDAHELALFGGEDYVLLFTLPRHLRPPADMGCKAIGEVLVWNDQPGVCEAEPVILRRASGEAPLPPHGWDHLAAFL